MIKLTFLYANISIYLIQAVNPSAMFAYSIQLRHYIILNGFIIMQVLTSFDNCMLLFRPTVAGIHGNAVEGCYSLALSGGYEDDLDYGVCFSYTGEGKIDAHYSEDVFIMFHITLLT
jgi:hypothetical protein